MSGDPARQTVSFLTRRFREAGIRPETRHGQNFLIDLNLVQLLAETAEIGPRDLVLEIGTGTASLTAMLAERAGQVVTVEIDANLARLAAEELIDRENVTLVQRDALKNKNHFAPELITLIQDRLEADPQLRLKLVANLPYNIATPVISNLLSTPFTPRRMVVTIQKELADRLVARPRTKDYGALSVWVQSQCDVEIVRVLGPQVFWPRPKVHSAIVRIDLNESRRALIPDREQFHTFVRAMFFHRRKFLRSVVLSAFKNRLDKPAVDEVLGALQLGPDARAEQLTVAQLLELCTALHARLPVE